ncbi:hypothetical protein BJX99DRAFT_254089 [Aspergillus californicus]
MAANYNSAIESISYDNRKLAEQFETMVAPGGICPHWLLEWPFYITIFHLNMFHIKSFDDNLDYHLADISTYGNRLYPGQNPGPLVPQYAAQKIISILQRIQFRLQEGHAIVRGLYVRPDGALASSDEIRAALVASQASLQIACNELLAVTVEIQDAIKLLKLRGEMEQAEIQQAKME